MTKKFLWQMVLAGTMACGIFIFLPHAARAATLALSPTSGGASVGNTFTVSIILDTAGQAVYGVDIYSLHFNPSILQVVDADSGTSGVQISPGTLMPNNQYNTVNNTTGTIQFSQTSSTTGTNFTGNGTLATITFRAQAAGTSAVTFDFTAGSTTDTNVAVLYNDVLTAVTNGSYAVSGTADTTAPSAPGNLSAAAASQTQINLSWDASTDNLGVAGYKIYRCTGSCTPSLQIATTTSTTYNNTGLVSSTTYTYRVAAYDSANNISAQSSSASATTQADAAPSGGGGGGGGGSGGGGGGGGGGGSGTTPIISNLIVTPYNGETYITWTNPADSTFVRAAIVRKEGVSAPASVNDGTKIYEGAAQSYLDEGLANGTVYSYAAFPVTASGYASSATAVSSATPLGSLPQYGGGAASPPPVSGASLRLVVDDTGTYWLIKTDNKRHGVTNPGMLYSYGFAFSDAKPATAQDMALPEGDLLLPGDGALVKSPEDPTVWLISLGQKHGFTSAAVFSGLGFSFGNVLVVTAPELGRQGEGDIISDPNSAHLPGLDINDRGTVYWVSFDRQKQGYPSLDVYNSWHIDNDFSKVVPANAADMALPEGPLVAPRLVQ